MGCSPDSLVGDAGLLEIKAPLPQTQIGYWISGELSERFRPQLQGQLYIIRRSWAHILWWHDIPPKLVMRGEPDEKLIEALDRELRNDPLNAPFHLWTEGRREDRLQGAAAN
jgi:hypothetical protein